MIGILGHTGLVGSYIYDAFPEAETFNTQNSSNLIGKEFELLFISAMPAQKWKANSNPQEDSLHRLRLEDLLGKVQAKKVILISTVDVFSEPSEKVESSEPDLSNPQAYGRNRALFEQYVMNAFQDVWTIRLPGLVGERLKKNVLFDIKHHLDVSMVPSNSQFQFYPLHRLAIDLKKALTYPAGIFHFAVEPLFLSEIVEASSKPGTILGESSDFAPKYNFLTEKMRLAGNYLVSKTESLEQVLVYLNE